MWDGMRREPSRLRTQRDVSPRCAGAPPFGPVRGLSADTRVDRPVLLGGLRHIPACCGRMLEAGQRLSTG